MKHLDQRNFSYKGQKSMYQSDINHDIFQDVDNFIIPGVNNGGGNNDNLYFDAPIRGQMAHPIFHLGNDDHHGFDDVKPFTLADLDKEESKGGVEKHSENGVRDLNVPLYNGATDMQIQ